MAESSITAPVIVSGLRVPGSNDRDLNANGPLRTLYSNRFQQNLFQFPSDLGSDDRGHVITFTVQEQLPSSQQGIQPSGTSLETENNERRDAATEGVTTTTNSTLERAQQVAGDFFRINPKRKEGDTVALYVPDTVNVQYAAQYSSDIGLTSALGKPLFLAQGAASIYDKYSSQKSIVDNLTSVANDPFARAAAASAVENVFGTGGLQQLALAGVGYAFNPQLQVLFSNIGFRQFQFDFILAPKNQGESAAIQNIIRVFKKASAPKFEEGFITKNSMFLKVPDTFKIKFLYKGEENLNVNRIGECVLEAMDVDYSPVGWSTFNDGSAVQTRLTMQFKETFIIDKNRIEEGY
jgi:hypothetical protein